MKNLTNPPWNLTANSWQYTTIYAADGTPICRLNLEDWGVTEDNQSDLERVQAKIAALIAAAPDLLAALKDLSAAYAALRERSGYDEGDESDSLDAARAAISKAGIQP